MSSSLASDIINRCRIAIQSYEGRPNPAWSTGEKILCALILNDTETLKKEGYTIVEALDRLKGDLVFAGRGSYEIDVVEWLKDAAREVRL